jgi:hypothetical protein
VLDSRVVDGVRVVRLRSRAGGPVRWSLLYE